MTRSGRKFRSMAREDWLRFSMKEEDAQAIFELVRVRCMLGKLGHELQ